jgi:hypothetical protein
VSKSPRTGCEEAMLRTMPTNRAIFLYKRIFIAFLRSC